MTSPAIEVKEPIIHPGKIMVSYRHSAGIAGSRFLRGLQKKKILGIRCHACNRVYVPPQIVCPECYNQLDEWVELDGRGTLLTYTVIYYSLPVHPVDPPFIIGSILVDGADTALGHLISEVEINSLEIGMVVEPVFKETPEGNILDIKYFRPV